MHFYELLVSYQTRQTGNKRPRSMQNEKRKKKSMFAVEISLSILKYFLVVFFFKSVDKFILRCFQQFGNFLEKKSSNFSIPVTNVKFCSSSVGTGNRKIDEVEYFSRFFLFEFFAFGCPLSYLLSINVTQ